MQVIEATLPKAPLDTTVTSHWLAIEGIQPAIPENASVKGTFLVITNGLEYWKFPLSIKAMD